jgi:arylamine N-acetyltransferase
VRFLLAGRGGYCYHLNGALATLLGWLGSAVKSKLDKEYPADEEVDRVVDEERRRFADARIHTFLPILIERSARSRLATWH